MSANHKKSFGWTALLILFGMLALLGGIKSLALLIPAAAFVWVTAKPTLGRN